MTDCPKCPHPAADHGTYGCLYGWEQARYSQSIIPGCRCDQRDVQHIPSPWMKREQP